jgi:hypothetical protein
MKIYKILLGAFFICFTSLTVFAQDTNWQLQYGKYNCTASKYSNGSYEFIPRGSFTISANGTYTYSGFEKNAEGDSKLIKMGICYLLEDI